MKLSFKGRLDINCLFEFESRKSLYLFVQAGAPMMRTPAELFKYFEQSLMSAGPAYALSTT